MTEHSIPFSSKQGPSAVSGWSNRRPTRRPSPRPTSRPKPEPCARSCCCSSCCWKPSRASRIRFSHQRPRPRLVSCRGSPSLLPTSSAALIAPPHSSGQNLESKQTSRARPPSPHFPTQNPPPREAKSATRSTAMTLRPPSAPRAAKCPPSSPSCLPSALLTMYLVGSGFRKRLRGRPLIPLHLVTWRLALRRRLLSARQLPAFFRSPSVLNTRLRRPSDLEHHMVSPPHLLLSPRPLAKLSRRLCLPEDPGRHLVLIHRLLPFRPFLAGSQMKPLSPPALGPPMVLVPIRRVVLLRTLRIPRLLVAAWFHSRVSLVWITHRNRNQPRQLRIKTLSDQNSLKGQT